MNKDKLEILVEANKHANNVNILGWGVCGFFLGFIGVIIAYMSKPKTPIELLLDYSDDAASQWVFEKKYIEVMQNRQRTASWLGMGAGGTLLLLALCTGGMAV